MSIFNPNFIIPNYSGGYSLALFVHKSFDTAWFGVVDTDNLHEVDVSHEWRLFKNITHAKLQELRLALLDIRYGKVSIPSHCDSMGGTPLKVNAGEFTVAFYGNEILITGNEWPERQLVTMNSGDYDRLLGAFLNL